MGGTLAKDLHKTETKNFKVVAAIDFGTANTGYAFSLVNSPDNIWTGVFQDKMEKDREPTMALLDEHQTLLSFGLEARRQYFQLSEDEQKTHFLFRLVKMKLYETTKLAKDTIVKDQTGKEMNAIDLFSMIIKHIVGLAHDVLKDYSQQLNIERDDVQWMLTVPAIWPYEARQFMISAAEQSGIKSSMLRLVLEPEAASLYCKTQLMNIVGAQSISELPVGHRYILADLGGGTLDVCAHEILPKAELKELWHVSGGAFGGERVDFEFEQYLIKIFGGPVWSEFKCEYPSCYLEMIEEFETAKTRFDGKRKSKLKIQKAFIETIKTNGEESFEDSIAAFKTEVQYDKNNQTLVIGANKMKALFHHSVKGILETIEQVLQKSSGVESLLLVGGYAESQYVREEIKNAFSRHVQIVLEQNPQLAVMKGAVKMGYTPKNIIARKSKFTIGFASTKPFNPRLHNSDLMVTRNGKSFCDDVFEVLIEVGQELVYNASFPSTSREYLGTELKGQDIFFTIYRSTERKPEYCMESETCQKVGELRMKSPAGGWPKSVKFNRNITVGETMLHVKVFNHHTHDEYEADIDFLA